MVRGVFVRQKMRRLMVIVGGLLLLVGIVLEGLYFANSSVNMYGMMVSQNTFLATGAVLLIAGLIVTWAGLKITKVQTRPA